MKSKFVLCLGAEVNLRFEVPKGTNLKDLVFNVIGCDDRAVVKTQLPTDFRVRLGDN